MEDTVKLFSCLSDLRKESDEKVYIPSFTVTEEKSHFLINMIQNIENKPENEVITFIQKYYTSFLNYRLFTDSELSRSSMQRLFTNTYFLNILFNTLGSLKLDSFEKLFLNRLAYDWISTHSKDDPVYNIYLQIVGYINSTLTIKLGSKLAVNEARLLSMISNSIDVPEIRIHRINRFLVNCDNPVLDTQAMIDIMFYLYDKFLDPIIYTLLETESCCTTEEHLPQYHRLLNAITSILLSIPKEKMIKVITEYGYVVSSKNITPPVKLKDIQDERLQEVIKIVEQDPLIKEIK